MDNQVDQRTGKHAKTLLTQTVKKYMQDFRLARIFTAWVQRVCLEKNWENLVLHMVIKKSCLLQRLSFRALHCWKNARLLTKKTQRERIAKVEEMHRARLAKSLFQAWKNRLEHRIKFKAKVFGEWSKVSKFRKRQRKIELLKAEIIAKSIQELTKNILFAFWKNQTSERVTLKNLAFKGLLKFTLIQRNLKKFMKNKQNSNNDLKTTENIFRSWLNSSKKLINSKKFCENRRKLLIFKQLVENSKKSFTSKLFQQKCSSHYFTSLKSRALKSWKIKKTDSKAKKHSFQTSLMFFKTNLLKKSFQSLQLHQTFLRIKISNLRKSLDFWSFQKMLKTFDSLKSYFLLRKGKKENLRKARQQRVSDLQKETIVSWINASISLKTQNEALETRESIEKQNKVYRIVQKFINKLKSRVKPKPAVQSASFFPTQTVLLEETIQYEPRKRPEPRRLVRSN